MTKLLICKKTSQAFEGVHHNAKVFLILHPLYAIPFAVFSNYEALYRQSLGLTNEQLGLLAGILMFVRGTSSLFGGFVTDRLGRKLTTTLMDTLCWSIPTLIWAYSKNFTWFLAGTIFNGVNSIVSTSFNCMFVEGTTPNKRVFTYSIFSTLGITAGFFTPLGGLLVNKLGMIVGGRVIYLISFTSITAMIIIRHFLMIETPVGLAKIAETREDTFVETLRDYGKAVKHIFSNSSAIITLLLFGVFSIQTNMLNSICHPLFLTGYLGYSKAQYGIFPMINSAITIAVLLSTLHFMQGREKRGLVVGMIILAIGWLMMGLLTKGSTFMVILATAFVAAGWAFFNPGLNTVWSNAISDEIRAKSQSIKDVFSAFITIPSGYIGAKLYGFDPRMPYMLMVGLFIGGTVLYVWTTRRFRGFHQSLQNNLRKAG